MELRTTHSSITLSLNVNIKIFSMSTGCLVATVKILLPLFPLKLSVQITEKNISLFCIQYQFAVLLLFLIALLPGGSVKYKSLGTFRSQHLQQIPFIGWTNYLHLRFFLPFYLYTQTTIDSVQMVNSSQETQNLQTYKT